MTYKEAEENFDKLWKELRGIECHGNMSSGERLLIREIVSYITAMGATELVLVAAGLIDSLIGSETNVDEIMSTSASENGFDIRHDDGQTSYLCEAKAYVPLKNQESFGGPQKEHILTDIMNLNGDTPKMKRRACLSCHIS